MHFLLVIWGAYPFNREPKVKMDFYAMNYCNPYFAQDWRMFAPGSSYNYTIYARYVVNGKEEFAFPIQEVLNERNIFNGREFLTISLTDACIFVHNSSIKIKGDLYKFNRDRYYQIFEHIVQQYLQNKHEAKIDDLKLMLLTTNIQTNERGYVVNE
jgi:hypothetical protein